MSVELGYITDVTVSCSGLPLDTDIKFYITHSQGYVSITCNHDAMTTLRAMIMYCDNSPETPIIQTTPVIKAIIPATLEYYGYGDMYVQTTGTVEMTISKLGQEIRFSTATYSFPIDRYVHEEFIEEPYYFYEGKTKVGFYINHELMVKAIDGLNKFLPYERFNPFNTVIYKYIQ